MYDFFVRSSIARPTIALFIAFCASKCVNADVVSFRNGVDGYASVRDTYLQNNLGSAHESIQLYVQLGDNMFSTRNSLIVFDNIFGSGASQIPWGSSIASATLEFQTRNQADAAGAQVNFHRMLMNWDQEDTKVAYGEPPWNDQDWVQADGFESSALSGGSFLPDQINSVFQVDVTGDVQLWANGAANFGWVMLGDPGGPDDSVLFFSSDYATVSGRPRLIVEFNSIPEPASLVITACGLLALACRSRRRTR